MRGYDGGKSTSGTQVRHHPDMKEFLLSYWWFAPPLVIGAAYVWFNHKRGTRVLPWRRHPTRYSDKMVLTLFSIVAIGMVFILIALLLVVFLDK